VLYLQGHFPQNDNGPGDTECQALVCTILFSHPPPFLIRCLQTQGATHLQRGDNFVAMLKALPNGMPSQHTINIIEGVSHQNEQMFNSTQLRQRVSNFKNLFCVCLASP